MGYPVDVFLNLKQEDKIPHEFICCVCHDVLKNPRMIASCQHQFCKECVAEWMSTNHRTCPECRVNFNRRDLQPPQRSFMNLMNRLQLPCSFEGCGDILELGDFQQHQQRSHGILPEVEEDVQPDSPNSVSEPREASPDLSNVEPDQADVNVVYVFDLEDEGDEEQIVNTSSDSESEGQVAQALNEVALNSVAFTEDEEVALAMLMMDDIDPFI